LEVIWTTNTKSKTRIQNLKSQILSIQSTFQEQEQEQEQESEQEQGSSESEEEKH
jgi:hypothetical protein